MANLDLVRSIVAAWERGDFSSAEWADPEVEFVREGGVVRSDTRTGLAGMSASFREFLSAWKDVRLEAEEFRELDDERVLVAVRWSARGTASGLEVGQLGTKAATLFHIRNGKVTRLALINRQSALHDLGLASEGGSQR